MRILIVDDETLARSHLRRMVEEIGSPYQVVAEAGTGEEALQRYDSQGAELVLLDIRMPGMDGLIAAQRLSQRDIPPAVIFTTAYEEHALAAFDSNAVAYLLKPIRRERLEQALHRAARLTRPQLQALQQLEQEEQEQYVSTTFRGGRQRIALDDILSFRAEQKYVVVRHAGGESLLEESLASLEERFGDRFLRIHRNALVARSRLQALEKGRAGRWWVRLNGGDERLEVSRRHVAQVRRFLKGEI
jgi:two-component system response regulator AlgR